MRSSFLFPIFISATFIICGCTAINNTQYYDYLSTSVEAAECLTNYSFPATLKLTGTAKYFKRGVNLITQYNSITTKTDLVNIILGDPLQLALPIKYAEIIIYNSKNQIIQCGRTDSEGFLKSVDGVSDLLLPAAADSYAVQVLSRVRTQFSSYPGKPVFSISAAVKKDKYTNKLYTLAKVVNSNGLDDSSVDLLAYARQTDSAEINGGAFNILNDIFTTFSYISQNTGTVDTQCLNKKVDTYWKAGFNPYQYLYPQSDPSTLGNNSYYDGLGDKTLNITGGRLGNTSIENTDHFDDFVIVHELGHFIEDNCGQLTSPGGSHQIVSRIDPRLAWSEGWANYLAVQVLYNNMVQINPEFEGKMFNAGFTSATDRKWSFLSSTIGFSDSSLNVDNGTGFMFDMKKPGNNPDSWQYGPYNGSSYDKIDSVRYPGEGHFREGAISRGFFKLTNACGVNCALSPVPFEYIWRSVNKITGAGNPAIKFKSSHTILENVKVLLGGSWAGDNKAKIQSEALHLFSDNSYLVGGINKWIPYGSRLQTVQATACPTIYIEPRSDDPALTATNSDQRYSNHFYSIDFSALPPMDQITVTFTKQNPSGTTTEFDLLLFQEGYFFNTDYLCSSVDTNGSCLTSFVPSRTTNSSVVRSDRRSGSTLTSKKITLLSSLDSSKKYLLNIRAFTAGLTLSPVTDYSYQIQDALGNYICP